MIRTNTHRSSLGFTMIELLVAATIIAILSAIGLVSFSSALKSARDGKRQSDLQQVRSALELYRSASATGIYPPGAGNKAGWDSAVSLLNSPGGFIPVATINDPINDLTHYYSYINPAPGQPANNKTYQVCANSMETAGVWGVVGHNNCFTNP